MQTAPLPNKSSIPYQGIWEHGAVAIAGVVQSVSQTPSPGQPMPFQMQQLAEIRPPIGCCLLLSGSLEKIGVATGVGMAAQKKKATTPPHDFIIPSHVWNR
jgi:hypothetical protein